MKKLVLLLIILITLVNAQEQEAKKESDSLNVKTEQDIFFKNGFGTIYAKPMLKDKQLQENIKLQGEYNVEKNKNAVIKFNKLQYKGKLYDLSNPFSKKGRLKKRDIVMKKDSNILVTGGDKQEFLDIINSIKDDEKKSKDTKNNENDNTVSNASIPSSSYPSSSNDKGFSPLAYDNNNDDSDNDTSTSNDSLQQTVQCDPNFIKDGIATYYVQQGLICAGKTSNAYYPKYNTSSCPNKVDYEKNTIQLGSELYVTDIQAGEFLVRGCVYDDAIELLSEVGMCKAKPNYEKNTAQIQKQYYYIFKNQREDVGNCTPTDETINLESEVGSCTPGVDFEKNEAILRKQFFYVLDNQKVELGECTISDDRIPLENDLSSCEDERHDFTINKSFAQTQYFYTWQNVRYDIGDCVDAGENYIYNHYLDDTTCQYQVIDGRVLYKQRVAYDDLLGVKKFATDCQTTSSGGLEMQEEFAGYTYQDATKQAIRRINTYFFIPGTTTKEYVDKGIETSKAYPYIEKQCNVVNSDENLTTTFFREVTFEDTDENKLVELYPCQADKVIPYQKLSVTEVLVDTLTKQITLPSGTGYKILGTDKMLVGQPNWTRKSPNHTSSNVKAKSSVKTDLAYTYNYIKKYIGNNWLGTIFTGTIGDFTYKYSLGNWRTGGNVAFNTLSPKAVNISVTPNDTSKECGDNWCYDYGYIWRFALKPNYADNQIIDVIESQQDYLRADGTTYTQPNSGTLKYIAK
ncbi:hypothetical protein [Sulfurospirillum arcachonense]|uniref:hypothetical protein n=1 Tax=Sulfurospirillum arcachonense TaxID=57666 RepID=UPI0004689FAA|nr:hypothetical protein [Sulfurospirillum arcachonense]